MAAIQPTVTLQAALDNLRLHTLQAVLDNLRLRLHPLLL